MSHHSRSEYLKLKLTERWEGREKLEVVERKVRDRWFLKVEFFSQFPILSLPLDLSLSCCCSFLWMKSSALNLSEKPSFWKTQSHILLESKIPCEKFLREAVLNHSPLRSAFYEVDALPSELAG